MDTAAGATPAPAPRAAPPPFEIGPGDSPPVRAPQSLWEWLRVIAKGLGVVLWTGVVVAEWTIGSLFISREPARRNAWRSRTTRRWARGLLRVMGARIDITGTRPAPPFCLVSNHVSYLDVLVYYSLLPARFVAKAEVKDWPAVGWLARTYGTLFIDRARPRDLVRVLAQMREAAQEGDAVVFFPEGTTSRGADLLPFRAPLLEIAARLRVPVAYAAIAYHSEPSAPPAVQTLAWWGAMPFTAHFLGVLALKRFTVRVRFGDEMLTATDRKALAAQAQTRVAALHEATTGAKRYDRAAFGA